MATSPLEFLDKFLEDNADSTFFDLVEYLRSIGYSQDEIITAMRAYTSKQSRS